MKLAVVGFGQAGGTVLDDLIAFDEATRGSIVTGTVVVNTARADLQGLVNVPKDRRVLIGQTCVKGHGVGADNEVGAEIAEEDVGEIQNDSMRCRRTWWMRSSSSPDSAVALARAGHPWCRST